MSSTQDFLPSLFFLGGTFSSYNKPNILCWIIYRCLEMLVSLRSLQRIELIRLVYTCIFFFPSMSMLCTVSCVSQFETMVLLCTVPTSSAEGVKCCWDKQEWICSGLLRSMCASFSLIFLSFILNEISLWFYLLYNLVLIPFIVWIISRTTTMK